jgi:tetratricopeptide (TPR) repeat protein
VGDEPDLLEALDRLYTQVAEYRELADVLERRVAIVGSPVEQATLHYRLAKLFIGEFSEPSRGLGSLRAALEANPDHEQALEALEGLTGDRDLFEEASEVLEGVYRSSGRTDRLAALYEKRVGFASSPEERIDMRRNLARVLEDEGKDPGAAQRVLQQGLADNPADSGLLDEIERLAPITGNWEGAASALRDAVEKTFDLVPDVARDLSVRVASWYRDHASDPTSAEKAQEKALEFDNGSEEVLIQIEHLQAGPGRERDLVQTLRRRAKLQFDDDARLATYRRAKELADQLGDRELAESILRELVSKDDANLWALGELTVLREAAGDYKEVFSLLLRRVDLGVGPDESAKLRHEAARIARERLKDTPRAIELYYGLFEDDPLDAAAAQALRELYEANDEWRDLARLLERLIDVATSPADRNGLRLELAALQTAHFDAPERAIDLLRTALDEEPGRADAVTALSDLYTKGEQFEDLAKLLTEQSEEANKSGNVEAELAFQVRLGDLYEQHLSDRARAIDAYESILGRNAGHPGALKSLVRLYQAADNHEASARTLESLVGVSSGAEAQALAVTLADEYRALGDEDRATAALERGLSVDPSNTKIRDLLRAIYEKASAWDKMATLIAGDADLASSVDEKVKLLRKAAQIRATKKSDPGGSAELLEKASALKPDDRELMLELCDAYSASSRGRDAVLVLEKIVQSFGGKRSKELAEIHRRLSKAYLSDGDTARATDELDKAFRIEPGNVHVLKELGDVSIQAGDLKKAQQMFRALLLQKLEAGGPITKAQVFASLGDVHLRLGEKEKAAQMLERALATDASLDRARQLLAEAKS